MSLNFNENFDFDKSLGFDANFISMNKILLDGNTFKKKIENFKEKYPFMDYEDYDTWINLDLYRNNEDFKTNYSVIEYNTFPNMLCKINNTSELNISSRFFNVSNHPYDTNIYNEIMDIKLEDNNENIIMQEPYKSPIVSGNAQKYSYLKNVIETLIDNAKVVSKNRAERFVYTLTNLNVCLNLKKNVLKIFNEMELMEQKLVGYLFANFIDFNNQNLIFFLKEIFNIKYNDFFYSMIYFLIERNKNDECNIILRTINNYPQNKIKLMNFNIIIFIIHNIFNKNFIEVTKNIIIDKSIYVSIKQNHHISSFILSFVEFNVPKNKFMTNKEKELIIYNIKRCYSNNTLTSIH